MAIIVSKDIGFGGIFDAYVTLDVGWTSSFGGRWEVGIAAWISKEARELSIAQEWIQYRLSDVSVEIPYNEMFAQKWGLLKENWKDQTSPGPWDDVEELEHMKNEYIDRLSQPAQRYSSFFYDREGVKGLPKTLDTAKAKKHFYKAIKDPTSQLFDVISSRGISEETIKKSIKDDMETKKDVVLRLAKKDPLLTKLAPSESALMFPDEWE